MVRLATKGSRAPCLANIVQNARLNDVRDALSRAGSSVVHDIVSNEQTLLFHAVQRKEHASEVCQLLLDVYRITALHVDVFGQTALHWLATTSNAACVSLLVDRQCDVNHVDALLQQTPLFYAAHRGSFSMVQKLLEVGANENIRDSRGKMPISWVGSVDTCRALAAHCAVSSAAGSGDRPAMLAGVAAARRSQRRDCAGYIAKCADALGMKGRMSWVVREEASSSGGGSSAYVTSLTCKQDVAQLCELEDEFIDDHRRLLNGDINGHCSLSDRGSRLTDVELFEELGLMSEQKDRHCLIKSMTGIDWGSRQKEAIRHFTLTCRYLKPGSACKNHQVVGYVYFRVCDGVRKAEVHRSQQNSDEAVDGERVVGEEREGEEELSSEENQAEEEQSEGESEQDSVDQDKLDSTGNGLGYVVISHIKVRESHQKRGVATLLLAGALRVAEKGREGVFRCTDLYLSVSEQNCAARKLYERLGFIRSERKSDNEGWMTMDRKVTEPCLADLSSQWMRLVWDTPAPSSDSRGACPGADDGTARADDRSCASSCVALPQGPADDPEAVVGRKRLLYSLAEVVVTP
jgi:ribosomal protein S18 acetylase RimI-like enzyme